MRLPKMIEYKLKFVDPMRNINNRSVRCHRACCIHDLLTWLSIGSAGDYSASAASKRMPKWTDLSGSNATE